MRSAVSVCVLLALGAATAVVAQSGPTPAPRFAVDLDADPLTRWVPIVSQFADRYAPIVQYLDTMYPPILQPIFDPILADLDKYIPAPYADELRGVAQAINGASGMDLGKILLLNIVYDISAFCTSIAAQTAEGGAMIHGRNLDYPFPGLQNITATIDFQRNGVTVYTGTTFVGYVGLLTGVRPQGWSVTVNQRNIPGDSVLDVLQNLLEGVEGAYPVGMRLRTTLETNATFDDAVATLQHVHLWGPVYLTLAGTSQNQGVVITRDRNDPADVWFIDGPGTYYRGQTNDDHWQPPLDDRRAAMNEMMAQYNSTSISTAVLYEILSTAPLFNHATRYTTVMNPSTGQCDTTVRFDAPTKAQMDAAGWSIMF